MSFQYNGEGVEMTTGFQPFPIGNYELTIVDTEEKTTKKGDNMVTAKCEVTIGDHAGRLVWHNVTFLSPERKGAGMALQFLKTIGEPYQGVFVVNPENWKGKSFKARIGIEKDLKGNDRNVIQYLLNEENTNSDEIPF